MELIYEKSQAGRRAGRDTELRPARARGACGARPHEPSEAAGARGERDRSSLHEPRRPQLRRRHGLLPARLLHDEVQPTRQRARRRVAGLREPASPPGGRRRAGCARADVGAAGDPRRGGRAAGGDAAAGRRLAGGAHRPDADARLLRRSGRGRAARHDHHRRHGARDEPRKRDDGRLQAREGRDDRARQPRPRRPAREGERAHRGADADEPVHGRPVRRGHRRGGGHLPREGRAPLLRRGEPQRRRGSLAAR